MGMRPYRRPVTLSTGWVHRRPGQTRLVQMGWESGSCGQTEAFTNEDDGLFPTWVVGGSAYAQGLTIQACYPDPVG